MPRDKVVGLVTALVALASLLLSGWIEYTHTDAADREHQQQIEHRITAVEQKTTDEAQKVDHIQTQVDRLVQWALGSK